MKLDEIGRNGLINPNSNNNDFELKKISTHLEQYKILNNERIQYIQTYNLCISFIWISSSTIIGYSIISKNYIILLIIPLIIIFGTSWIVGSLWQMLIVQNVMIDIETELNKVFPNHKTKPNVMFAMRSWKKKTLKIEEKDYTIPRTWLTGAIILFSIYVFTFFASLLAINYYPYFPYKEIILIILSILFILSIFSIGIIGIMKKQSLKNLILYPD